MNILSYVLSVYNQLIYKRGERIIDIGSSAAQCRDHGHVLFKLSGVYCLLCF